MKENASNNLNCTLYHSLIQLPSFHTRCTHQRRLCNFPKINTIDNEIEKLNSNEKRKGRNMRSYAFDEADISWRILNVECFDREATLHASEVSTSTFRLATSTRAAHSCFRRFNLLVSYEFKLRSGISQHHQNVQKRSVGLDIRVETWVKFGVSWRWSARGKRREMAGDSPHKRWPSF